MLTFKRLVKLARVYPAEPEVGTYIVKSYCSGTLLKIGIKFVVVVSAKFAINVVPSAANSSTFQEIDGSLFSAVAEAYMFTSQIPPAINVCVK
jgi:hypothetical protein